MLKALQKGGNLNCTQSAIEKSFLAALETLLSSRVFKMTSRGNCKYYINERLGLPLRKVQVYTDFPLDVALKMKLHSIIVMQIVERKYSFLFSWLFTKSVTRISRRSCALISLCKWVLGTKQILYFPYKMSSFNRTLHVWKSKDKYREIHS